VRVRFFIKTLIFLGFAGLLLEHAGGGPARRRPLPSAGAGVPADRPRYRVARGDPQTRGRSPHVGEQPHARAPRQDWWTIIKRAAVGFSDDRIMAEAAGVTFYAMLALFPALAGLISIYGLVADPAKLGDQMQTLDTILPGGGQDIIKAQVMALTSSTQTLGVGLVVGLAVSLWSANAGVKALFDALNVVYRTRETRNYLRLTLISLAFTMGIIALTILALVAVVVVPVALDYVGLEEFTKTLIAVARWPGMLVLVILTLAPVYRYGPDRRRTRLQWVSWGSVFAAVAWIVASLGFSYYVANFGSYNKTYGSLGAVVGFMTWIWLSAMVVLMGAELNAEIGGYDGQDPGLDQARL
jgi:membrane protein